MFAEEKQHCREMIQRRNDTNDKETRRDLTRRIAKLQRSICRREARLRRLGKALLTMTQALILTDAAGNEFTMPTTTRQAVLSHYSTNYGGGEEVAQELLRRWTSRRNAARLDGQAGNKVRVFAITMELHMTKQAKNLRKASGDDGISPEVLQTLGKLTAHELADATNQWAASDDLVPPSWLTTRLTMLPKGRAKRHVKQQRPIGVQSLTAKATASARLSTYGEDLKPRHTNTRTHIPGKRRHRHCAHAIDTFHRKVP